MAAPIEPGPLAVPLAEMKAFLRIGHGDEDPLIAGLARSAAEACEAFTGRVMIAREIAEVVPAPRGWTRLGSAPVQAIEAIAALATDGTETALAADAYAVDIDAAGEGWVRLTRPVDAARIKVSYRAGLAEDATQVPEALRHGMIRLAAHLYTHRDRAEGGQPPAAVTALWRPWRRLRLG